MIALSVMHFSEGEGVQVGLVSPDYIQCVSHFSKRLSGLKIYIGAYTQQTANTVQLHPTWTSHVNTKHQTASRVRPPRNTYPRSKTAYKLSIKPHKCYDSITINISVLSSEVKKRSV